MNHLPVHIVMICGYSRRVNTDDRTVNISMFAILRLVFKDLNILCCCSVDYK